METPLQAARSPTARRVSILTNPKAGSRPREAEIAALGELLKAEGCEPAVIGNLEELRELSLRWHAAGELRALVAAGGDGTLSLAANIAPPGTPLTVLPLGTENLLARYFRIRPNPAEVCQTVLHGQSTLLDAGLANGRLFLLMAGVGFDADVVRRMHARRRGNIQRLSYCKPVWEAIRNYQYPEVRIYCSGLPGGEVQVPLVARWAFVANLPCYAAGLRIVPEAIGNDGQFDVRAFSGGSVWKLLQYLALVAVGRPAWFGSSQYARGTRIRIVSEAEVPYQLDGDPGGFLPLEIEVLPQRVTLLLPVAP